ncbi:MAG: phage holin family protein [Candidatus Eisenbacteria bacterium]|uniref:Phage holin family protein n=1 Tax=Eiseniibacteriota bacterium TaxID=2212470 RepID=A0A938BPP3_UNCEI|nr:phage holin family protein [Candidatus Eisenbacteria bacterium]
MQGFLVRFVVTFFALGFTTAIVPGIELHGEGPLRSGLALGAAALVLGLLNAVVRPILIFFTLPLTIMTLGLSVLVLNGLLLWFTSSVVKGFEVTGFWAALLGTIILSLISGVLNAVVRDKRERTLSRRGH